MLKERPAIIGVAAPGMPVGLPGMEVAGQKPDAYDVIAFDKAGKTSVYASQRDRGPPASLHSNFAAFG